MPLEKDSISFFIHEALNKDAIFIIFINSWKFDRLIIYAYNFFAAGWSFLDWFFKDIYFEKVLLTFLYLFIDFFYHQIIRIFIFLQLYLFTAL